MTAMCENSNEPNVFTSRFIDAAINRGKDRKASIKIRFAFTSPDGWFPMMRKLGNIGDDGKVFFSGIESTELLGAATSPVSPSPASSSGQSNADDKSLQPWEMCGAWAAEKKEEEEKVNDDEADKRQSYEEINKVEDDIDRILFELNADLNGEEEETVVEKRKREQSHKKIETERLESLKLRASR